jgi:hypothetical protein
MGIAQAIARVKKGVREGGIPAVMAELGEQLRSQVIPEPLRPAAVRLAALLRAGTPAEPAQARAQELADATRDTRSGTPVGDALVSACPFAAAPAAEADAVAEFSAVHAPSASSQAVREPEQAEPTNEVAASARSTRANKAESSPAKSAAASAVKVARKPPPSAKPARTPKREKEKPQAQEELASRGRSANTLARAKAKPLTKRSSAKASSKRK